jgi:adenine C2-methylase RlmN of 23S rRNA A2503 and tRNA A37
MTAPPAPIKSRSRKPPHPNSILDRQTLLTALDDNGLTIKAAHIDTFYQSLHRQHYPDLPTFVANYYINEEASAARVKESNNDNSSTRSSNNRQASASWVELQSPLKNAISTKKNRNLQQLPKVLLEFLKTTDTLVTVTSVVADAKTSADGSTTKLAIQLHDGQLVETVLMRYNRAVNDVSSASTTTTASDNTATNTSSPNKYFATSRASLCVSSQCGCAMGCTFCATGTMGLTGSLSAGEILEQIVHADRILAKEWRENQQLQRQRQLLHGGPQEEAGEEADNDEQQQNENDDQNKNIIKKKKKGKENTATNSSLDKLDLVRNVVFMGMGEPMDNYKNVVEACRALIDRRRWNLAHGRVTVSTVGIVSKIRRLTKELPEVSLAVSLHAPNQAMRSAIVPSAKHYPIEDLIEALDGHMMTYLIARKTRLKENQNKDATNQVDFTEAERIKESGRRRAMIEYVMLEGDTSTLKCAHELGKLCENRQLVVNLIPYNQTDVKDKLHCPSHAHMMEFRDIVASYGSFCTIRRTMGADIGSACGQLITLREKKVAEGDSSAAVDVVHMGDIEDAADDKFVKQKKASSRVVGSKSTTEDNVDDDSASSTYKVDLEQWIRPLATATAVAATCFLVSSVLILRQKRR